jgi:hypothetical protein
MVLTGKSARRLVLLAALSLEAGCGQPQRHNSAENEFNAWANGVEQEGARNQANATLDFEEPTNVMQRVVPANAH